MATQSGGKSTIRQSRAAGQRLAAPATYFTPPKKQNCHKNLLPHRKTALPIGAGAINPCRSTEADLHGAKRQGAAWRRLPSASPDTPTERD
ncbi:MAG: hypothetical protein LBC63_04760 [Holophagales bacterium]|nr:hypothetical protein [Holophagales bacterium]